MIVTAKQARAIANGQKTTHRVPHVTLTAGARIPITVRHNNRAELFCHAQITHTATDELRDLTRDELQREGYRGARGLLDYRRDWLETHDRDWMRKAIEQDLLVTDEAIAARFAAKWDQYPVHVLTLTVVEAPDRYLAPTRTGHATTTDPRRAIDDAAIPPDEYVDAEAKRIYEARMTVLAEARREAVGESFEKALARARAVGHDTRRAVRSVERIAAGLERAAERRGQLHDAV